MLIKTAERIKELREKNNLTQSELARRLNITRSSVNAWEMGISIPSTEKLVDICLILHTSSDYLLGLDHNEYVPLNQYDSDEKELIYSLIKYFDRTNNLLLCSANSAWGNTLISVFLKKIHPLYDDRMDS